MKISSSVKWMFWDWKCNEMCMHCKIWNRVKDENSINGEKRIIKKTPAVTIVAACIKAETGVGPSIASGNQVCKPNCADFPIAPINKNIPIKVKLCICISNKKT